VDAAAEKVERSEAGAASLVHTAWETGGGGCGGEWEKLKKQMETCWRVANGKEEAQATAAAGEADQRRNGRRWGRGGGEVGFGSCAEAFQRSAGSICCLGKLSAHVSAGRWITMQTFSHRNSSKQLFLLLFFYQPVH
jgi:hypothetical protein